MELVKKNLVFSNKDFKTKENAIEFLSSKLHKEKFVKATYQNAILEREKQFPTGLPTGEISVAIPHADSQHVNKSALAIATLKTPVKFKNMGEPEEELNVSIIIMLAIAEPKAQIKMLQNLMSIVQDQAHLKQLLAYNSEEELFKDLNNTFANVEL